MGSQLPYLYQDIPVDFWSKIIEADQHVPGGEFWLFIPVQKMNHYLGMLILSFLMRFTTLLVRLKMESLSGLTDLVVSMTNESGGLIT